MVLLNLLFVLIIAGIPILLIVQFIRIIIHVIKRAPKLTDEQKADMAKSARTGALNIFRHLFH